MRTTGWKWIAVACLSMAVACTTEKSVDAPRETPTHNPTDAPDGGVAAEGPTPKSGSDTKRGFAVATSGKDGEARGAESEHGRQVALLIGSDAYETWPKLSNAVGDVEAVGRDLRDIYGFDRVEILRNPTRRELVGRMRAYVEGSEDYEGEVLAGAGAPSLGPKDSVFVFVAGHGHYDPVMKTGHIVTVDAPDSKDVGLDYTNTHESFLRLADRMSAGRVMVVLDVCHGGEALYQQSRAGGYSERSADELLEASMRHRGRFLITSAGQGEVSDGIAGMHSPFATQLLETLREHQGGRDGLLTHHELFGELLPASSNAKEPPRMGMFGTSEPGSLFVMRRRKAARAEKKQDVDPPEASQEVVCGADPDQQVCAARGERAYYARGVPRDLVEAKGWYERACEGGELLGCAGLGYLLLDVARPTPEDERAARDHFEASCSEIEASGCGGLGLLHALGRAGLDKDVERGFELARRSCDARVMRGCRSLGWMYDAGVSVREDDEKAAKLYQMACARGDVVACSNLGVLFELGEGVSKDPARARTLWERACDGGVSRSCTFVGMSMLEPGAPASEPNELAFSIFKESCERRDPVACHNAFVMLKDGLSQAERMDVAVGLLGKACDFGLEADCSIAAPEPGRALARRALRKRMITSKRYGKRW